MTDTPTPALSARAELAARAWLTSIGPDLTGPASGRPDAYADHVVADGIEVVDTDHVVVSVSAVVLTVGDADQYDRAEPVRIGVALRRSDARPIGSPWWLPPRPLAHERLDLGPVIEDDRVVAATEAAVRGARYRNVAQVRVHAGPGDAVTAVFTGTAPGDRRSRRRTVLVIPEHGRLRVAGLATEVSR